MKKTKTMAFSNVISSLIFCAIAIYAIVASLGFKEYKNSVVNPSAFPQIMASGLLIFSLVLLVINLLKLPHDTEAAPSLSIKNRGIQHMLMCAAMSIAFYLLWEPVGFLILAPITLFILMYMIDMRRWSIMLIVSIALTLVIWLLFYKVLSISVPLGPLGIIYDVF